MAMLSITLVSCSGDIEKNPTAAALLEVTKSGSVLKFVGLSREVMILEECSFVKENDFIQETCRSGQVVFISENDALDIQGSTVSKYSNAGDTLRSCKGGNEYISQLRQSLNASNMERNGSSISSIEKQAAASRVVEAILQLYNITPGSDVCVEITTTADSQFMRTTSFDGVTADGDRQKFAPTGLNEAVLWGPNVQMIADTLAAVRNPVNQDAVSPIDAKQPVATDETGVRPNAAPSPPRGSLSTRDMQLIGVPPNDSDDPTKPDLLRPAGWTCDGVRVSFAPDTPWGKIKVQIAGQEDLWSMSVGTQGTVSIFEPSNQRFAGAQFLYEADTLAFNERPCEPA